MEKGARGYAARPDPNEKIAWRRLVLPMDIIESFRP